MPDLAERIADHYERHARTWDADRQAAGWNDKAWHDRFIAALPGAATVLDLGCGSGFPVARHMAGHGLRVTGVDPSSTLIALCRERLPDHEWYVGDMRSLRLPRSFDGVLAWDTFPHFTWMAIVFLGLLTLGEISEVITKPLAIEAVAFAIQVGIVVSLALFQASIIGSGSRS